MVAFDLDEERIGTIRIVPMGYHLTLTETLMEQLGPGAPRILPGDWEVGRLVLAPECRADVGALRHCLDLALGYAFSNARVDRLYASCTHVLGRLYRRFGFDAIAKDVPLLGTSKRYTLISGSARRVALALSACSASDRAVVA